MTKRRRLILPAVFALLSALVLAAGGYAAWKLLGPLPSPRVQLNLPGDLPIDPASPPPIPAPAQGSFDLVSSQAGELASRSPSTPAPIASIAKVMVALVTLQKKPLSGDQPGPTYAITAQDVADYRLVSREGGSRLAVSLGEQFSERQLLLGLLLPSADNLADTLGNWVAGSDAAFVADLNAEARALGMSQTNFADDSGLSPQTVSTAADLVRLGQAALANPVLAQLVATRSAMMPGGTVVQNLDTNLGTIPGWLGIKTGYTGEAGGCLLFAADHPGPLGSSPVQVVGAILGQPASGPAGLGPALSAASAAIEAAFGAYDTVNPSAFPTPPDRGQVTSAWGTRAGILVALEHSAAPVEVRRGTTLSLSAAPVSRLPDPLPAGTVVAHISGRLAGRTLATWSVAATGGLGEPTWQWLLTH
ncbi:MAG: hypothetical protein WCB85_09465 [Candidatus Dormiibacterota bacterium]